MRYPLNFTIAQAKYQAKMQKKHGRRYPSVCMLEPLYTCNLSCRGCTPERHLGKLSDRLTVDQCLKAVEDSGVPIISVCGGEPLLYPELPELLSKLIERGKFIILCTNGLLIEEKLFGVIPPSDHLFVNFHLDGMKETHDYICQREGVWDHSVKMIKECKERGYLVWSNCTVYKETNLKELEALCDLLTELRTDGIMVAPGYQYQAVEQQEVFLTQEDMNAKFKQIMKLANKYKLTATPFFLEFAAGLRDLECSPYSTVNYTPKGWKSPCYLIDGEIYEDFKTFWEKVDWKYWESRKDPRCANCRMHSGFEQTAVESAMRSLKDMIRLGLWQFGG